MDKLSAPFTWKGVRCDITKGAGQYRSTNWSGERLYKLLEDDYVGKDVTYDFQLSGPDMEALIQHITDVVLIPVASIEIACLSLNNQLSVKELSELADG